MLLEKLTAHYLINKSHAVCETRVFFAVVHKNRPVGCVLWLVTYTQGRI